MDSINDVEQIYRNICPIPLENDKKRFSYIVLGKPGAGKTTLAEKLRDMTRSILINSETSLAKLITSESAVNGSVEQENQEILRSGGEISSVQLSQLQQKEITSEAANFRGFILDGIQGGNTSSTIAQIQEIVQVIKNHGNCVLVDIKIDDQDLIRSRASNWLDPVTNTSYPGQQIVYSRLRKHEGWVEGEEDSFYVEERLKNNPYPGEQGGDQPDAGNFDETEEKENTPAASSPANGSETAPPQLFRNQTAYPIISEKVIDRLIKSPENEPSMIEKQLKEFSEIENHLESIRKLFNAVQIIELDGTQHPEQIADQLKTKMFSRGFTLNPLCEPLRLIPPEGGLKGSSETDTMKYFCNCTLRDGEPEREVSRYKKYCPVSFALSHSLIDANMDLVACYKGKIYFFNNEEKLNSFLINPTKYLSAPLTVPSSTVAIFGPPFKGQEAAGKAFARHTRLGYISLNDTLKTWESQMWMSEDPALQESYNDIKISLLEGGALSADQMVNVIDIAIKRHQNTCNNVGLSEGWVLDQFPLTKDQLTKLVAKGIVPDRFYCIKSELSDFMSLPEARTSENIPLNRVATIPHKSTVIFESVHAGSNVEVMDVIKEIQEIGKKPKLVNWPQNMLSLANFLVNELNPFLPQIAATAKLSDEILLFGATKDYCPVQVKLKNRLVKGDPAITVSYQNLNYNFSDQDAKLKFSSAPYYFVEKVMIPSPKLVFLGPSGSGKTTAMNILSVKYKVPVVDFKAYCILFAMQSGEYNPEIQKILQTNQVLPIEFLRKVLDQLFAEKDGWIMKGFPISKGDIELALKNKYFPDAFIALQVESAIAGKRNYKKQLGTPDALKLDELSLKADEENSASSDYQSLIETWGTVPIFTISAFKSIRSVGAEIERSLSSLLKNRSGLFSNARRLEEKVASSLLELGLKSYSSVGKYCPVELQKTKRSVFKNQGTVPVLVDDNIYFLLRKNVQEFCDNPTLYTGLETPRPTVPSTCCLIGTPKAGKTVAAQFLCQEMDAIHLTVPSVLQSILNGQEATALAETISRLLKNGESLPDNVIVDAVIMVSNRVIAAGKGWVLDGFPNTTEQAELLDVAGFKPHYVFNLILENEEALIRRTQLDFVGSVELSLPAMNVINITLERNMEWKKCQTAIKSLFNSKYSNWKDIDASRSKWILKQELVSLCEEAVKRRELYLELKTKGKSCPVSSIGLSNQYIRDNLSKFATYCPYSLLTFQVLNTKTSEYIAEYKDVYYCFCSKVGLDAFLKNPDLYTACSLPEHLPSIKSRADLKFPVQLQLKGYCPVSFQEGPSGFSSILVGDLAYISEYKQEYYAFASADKLNKFMATPWKYNGLTLPTKLPPPKAPIPITGLPVLGYLEQAVSSSLSNALVSVGKIKPKYPFRSLDQSASEYLGLFLKANNPLSKDWVRKSHSKKLDKYLENCDLMKRVSKIEQKEQSIGDLEKEVDLILSLKANKQ